jgi:hypothetical protein
VRVAVLFKEDVVGAKVEGNSENDGNEMSSSSIKVSDKEPASSKMKPGNKVFSANPKREKTKNSGSDDILCRKCGNNLNFLSIFVM